MKKFAKEFREFALRGSVMDLAVGVIIGGAFQKIISSLVDDVLTPPISLLAGKGDFAERSMILSTDASGQALIVLNYGSFIQNVVDFALLAIVIFFMVKGINTLRRRMEPEKATQAATNTAAVQTKPTKTTEEQKLLTEIRDLLKRRQN